MNPYYNGYQPSMGMGYWSFGDIIGHVILIVVLVFIIMWALRMIFGMGGRRGRWMGRGMGMGAPGMWHHQSALSILSERFAKGEISKEEYEEKKKVLMQ